MRRYTNEAVGRKVLDTLERRQRACVNACAGIPTELLETSGVIPIRDAQKAVWELWNVVWQVLKDPDGSHTTHFASVSLIKERAIEIRDKLATPRGDTA